MEAREPKLLYDAANHIIRAG
ncbi:hypothetical protein KEJ49_07805, partial [Candidatus Bathyarchaeota archaeon]|nr:hypothetical protein [Candidatus Bathyarchaeota archaeon]